MKDGGKGSCFLLLGYTNVAPQASPVLGGEKWQSPGLKNILILQLNLLKAFKCKSIVGYYVGGALTK